MTSCRSCPAWRQSLFREFDDAEVAALAVLKKPCHLSKGDVLFEQATPVRGMYCNANGLLKVLQKNQSGKVIFSRLVFPADSAGHRSLFIEACYKGTASVVSEAADVCFIEMADVLKLFSENSVFARSLIVKLAGELDRSVTEQIQMKEISSFARLCQLLEGLFENFSEAQNDVKVLRSAISKVDIARLLSVADETVIRWMADLKKEEIVDLRDRRFVLLNPAKLRAYAKG